jgi:nucleoside-diphosphate-sugar epimerase
MDVTRTAADPHPAGEPAAAPGSLGKVVVTGGSGRIGSLVVDLLTRQGYDVVNLDRKRPANGAKFHYVDLRERSQVQPHFDGAAAVCHLGEIPNVFGRTPEEVFSSNTAVASTVLQAAADVGVKRFIYTSTCQTYGVWGGPGGSHGRVAPERLPFDETLPLKPQNAYAASKVAGETYARMVAGESGMSVAIFRFPWVIAEQIRDGRLDWFDQEHRIHEGYATYLWGEDAARAYLLAIERPRPGCEAYHFVADDIWLSIPLRDALARQPEFTGPPLPDGWPDFRAPVLTDKARDHFGWRPAWSVHEAVRAYKARRAATPQG